MIATSKIQTAPARPVPLDKTALQTITFKRKWWVAAAKEKRVLKRYDIDAAGDKQDSLFKMAAKNEQTTHPVALFLYRLQQRSDG